MNFAKDILLIDFETTDVDLEKAKPLQLGAVLLDKNTLEEKGSFSSYIKQDLDGANPEALKVSGITEKHLESAPDQGEVIKNFFSQFGTDVMLGSMVQFLDVAMLRKMLKKANLEIKSLSYYHFLDIWPIAYTHLVKAGYSGGIRVDNIYEAFGLPPRGTHDALEDCRLSAEVLRKIVK
jgi:DNA polymerase III epsilon subunit-like protein